METPPLKDDYASQREENSQRHMNRRSNSWAGGALLLALGILLLLQQTGLLSSFRWWGVLILIPAGAAFINAWREFQAGGSQFNRRVGGLLTAGLIMTALTVMVVFNLNWNWLGPALLVAAGVIILARSLIENRGSAP